MGINCAYWASITHERVQARESADSASKPETLRRRLNFRERNQEYADLTTFSAGPSPSSLCRHETSALFSLGFG